jgi:hypothetical protein
VLNVACDLVEQIGAARRQYQLNALLGQRFRNAHTNARAGTRDQGTLATQIQIHCELSKKIPDARSGLRFIIKC